MAGVGLHLYRNYGSSPTVAAAGEYDIDPTYTGKIAVGDLVILNSGMVQEASGNSAGNLGEAVRPFGVFHGVRYINAEGDYDFSEAYDGVAGKAKVKATILPLGGRLWKVRGSSGITWTAADIGTTRNLIWAAPTVGRLASSRVTLGAANVEGHAMIHSLATEPGNGYTAAGVTEPWFVVEITKTATGLNVPYAVNP